MCCVCVCVCVRVCVCACACVCALVVSVVTAILSTNELCLWRKDTALSTVWASTRPRIR